MLDTRIYIADHRKTLEVTGGWVNCTLNYGSYVATGKQAFGNLMHVNNWQGRAAQTLMLPAESDCLMLFFPLNADLKVTYKTSEFTLLLGEILLLPISEPDYIKICQKQPDQEAFLFQQLVIASALAVDPKTYDLPLNAAPKNRLLPILDQGKYPIQLYIGAFYGKEESELAFVTGSKYVYIFVLAGNFEVEERLLLEEDGLALSQLEKVRVECLSSQGIIMLLTL